MIKSSANQAFEFFDGQCRNFETSNAKNYLFLVGLMLEMGHGVTKNVQKAFSYYKVRKFHFFDQIFHTFLQKSKQRASELGNSQALLNLGAYYMLGLYVPKNISKTITCMKDAAKKGNNVLAMLSLGQLYYEGTHVKCDVKMAFKYVKKSANLCFPPCQQMLGNMYDHNEGTADEKNTKKKAKECFALAAKNGEYISQARLALQHFLGDEDTKANEEKWLHYGLLVLNFLFL